LKKKQKLNKNTPMSTFIPIFMNLISSKPDIKINSELNPSAKEFIPENKKNITITQNINKEEEKFNEKLFDSLEDDFIKKNDWIFYV
jgi:hypothetical protein